MKMKKNFVTLLLFCAAFSFVSAQEETQYRYFAESNLMLGGGDFAPFWFVSNRHGTVSKLPQDFSLRMAFFKDFKKQNEQPTFLFGYQWDYAFGLDLIGAFNGKINSLHQAYAKVSYGPFVAALGNFEVIYGNQDFALSSGGFGWSGNSRPLPRLDIGIAEFTEVPFTKGWLELKGVFSNGFMADKRYVLNQTEPARRIKYDEEGEILDQTGGFTYNTLLHHKNVYLRVGGKSAVNYTVGVEHYVIWAGKNSGGIHLPVNLREYLNVVGAFMPADRENMIFHEADNRYGEHLGQVNNRLDVKLRNYTVSAYHQYFIDDASFRHGLISDGLYGLLVRSNQKQPVTGVLFEFLKTTDQNIVKSEKNIHGASNYYNNSVYTSGWTYFGQTIGTPLISSQFYNQDRSLKLPNNSVKAYHFGIDGYITNNITYRTLLTYSEYFKRPSRTQIAYLKNNFSFLTEASAKIKRWEGVEVKAAIGGDFGDVYGNNFGVMLGIRKSGVF